MVNAGSKPGNSLDREHPHTGHPKLLENRPVLPLIARRMGPQSVTRIGPVLNQAPVRGVPRGARQGAAFCRGAGEVAPRGCRPRHPRYGDHVLRDNVGRHRAWAQPRRAPGQRVVLVRRRLRRGDHVRPDRRQGVAAQREIGRRTWAVVSPGTESKVISPP